MFSAQVDFDWAAFVKQQQHRKELASLGTVVPVYKGRIFRRQGEDAIPRSGKDTRPLCKRTKPFDFRPKFWLGETLSPSCQAMN